MSDLQKARIQSFRKVIISDLGELTQDTRTIGDKIRYRIYYTQVAPIQSDIAIVKPIISDHVDIIITDPLDKGLSQVKVSNGGRYDSRTHVITWTITGSHLGRNAFVEFEAVIVSGKTIRNQAFLKSVGLQEGLTRELGKTNIVETTVGVPPELGWISFIKDAKPGEPPRVYMKDETTMCTTIRFDIAGVFVHEQRVNGITYHHLSIPGWAALTNAGEPELPIIGDLVEVPFNVKFTPEIVKSETTLLKGYSIYPAQPPLIDASARLQPFIIDKATYLADANYPKDTVGIADGDIAVIRGHRVVFLKVSPLQYNPVTRVITACTMIEVRLNYNKPAQLRGVDRRIESTAFEELLKASVLNYKDPQRYYKPDAEKDDKREVGCDYLIITHDAFYDKTNSSNPIVRLANWKQRKGYSTKVVKVGSITGGNDPIAIKKYIQNAYDHWSAVPSYVLLVGDSDLVRTFEGSTHPGEADPDSPQPPIETDLYYVTVDGSDYFPDIYIGRLPVDSLQEVTDVVNKIIAYEQNPPSIPAHAAFYTDISILGLFTDDNQGNSPIDGREGRPWIANTESIRQYLLAQNYNVDRIYVTDSGFPAVLNSQDPRQYHDGTNLPNDLRFPNYGWNGGAADITTAFNNGRFLMSYRGHGGWDGWGDPVFSNTDVAALNQNNLTPVIFSITCQTGWFDNETDDDTKGGRPAGDESFAEVLLRQPNAGAISVLGMTRNSWTGYNDFIIFGLFKAIWPAFSPNPAWSNHPTIPSFTPVRLLRMGQILNFGKMFMSRAYTDDEKRKYEIEMGHLFGDPEMPIWVQAPRNLKVTHPEGIGAIGIQEFVVLVVDAANNQAVPNATVVLTRGDKIVKMLQTHTNGEAKFELDGIGSGNLDITVTALSFRPYMEQIVVKPGGAELNRLDPQDGPEGQTIHVGGKGFSGGESVDLCFGDRPPITVTADSNGEFGQGSPTVDISVPVGYPHGLVNVIAHGKTSNLYAAQVFQVRDANPIDLWTYDQWDDSTWSVHTGDNPTWDSPDIQLYDTSGNPVASNNLVLGETYVVKVKVRNRTAFPAAKANIAFKWRNFGTGGPWEIFDNMPLIKDIPADPPGVEIVETSYSPQAAGHLCIKVEIDHVEDTSPNNNEGQENLHVGTSSSPTKVCFIIWNPTEEPAPVHLEVRQLIAPGQEKQERLWATWVNHPEPQLLQPKTRAEACVIVDPDLADVKSGTQAEFAVTAFVKGKMVGGVNLIIIKK